MHVRIRAIAHPVHERDLFLEEFLVAVVTAVEEHPDRAGAGGGGLWLLGTRQWREEQHDQKHSRQLSHIAH